MIADLLRKESRLLAYDIRLVLATRPTRMTEHGLRAFGCLFRQTALGFLVAAPDVASIRSETVFTFIVTVSDSRSSFEKDPADAAQ